MCQSGKFMSDHVHHGPVNFRIIFNTQHRKARARGLGGMIKTIVTSLVVHVMDLICLYLS